MWLHKRNKKAHSHYKHTHYICTLWFFSEKKNKFKTKTFFLSHEKQVNIGSILCITLYHSFYPNLLIMWLSIFFFSNRFFLKLQLRNCPPIFHYYCLCDDDSDTWLIRIIFFIFPFNFHFQLKKKNLKFIFFSFSENCIVFLKMRKFTDFPLSEKYFFFLEN